MIGRREQSHAADDAHRQRRHHGEGERAESRVDPEVEAEADPAIGSVRDAPLMNTSRFTTTSVPITPSAMLASRPAMTALRMNRHLDITPSLIDGSGPLGGVTLSLTLYRDGAPVASYSGTTNSSGAVTFTLTNAANGCYTAVVTEVAHPDWDGATPLNSFAKGVNCS